MLVITIGLPGQMVKLADNYSIPSYVTLEELCGLYPDLNESVQHDFTDE